MKNKINKVEKNKLQLDSLKETNKELLKNNKLTLKSQQIFRNKKKKVFTEETNIISLSVNDHKRIQLIEEYDSMETFLWNEEKSSI